MTEAALTHGQLAATLVVEGCLPMIAGTVRRRAPLEGVPLTPEERAKLGLTGESLTVFYPVGETGVFLDLGGATATVWFNGGDCELAASALETALARTYGKLHHLDDKPHPDQRDMRVRTDQVNLGGKRLAVVEVAYPLPGAGARQHFVVRVHAQQRVNE